MKAGDTVKHIPTGETWLLACAERGEVFPCGWPETIAKEADCELVEACGSEEELSMLKKWANSCGDRDVRIGVCRRKLAALEAAVRLKRREPMETIMLLSVRIVELEKELTHEKEKDAFAEEVRLKTLAALEDSRDRMKKDLDWQNARIKELEKELAKKAYK